MLRAVLPAAADLSAAIDEDNRPEGRKALCSPAVALAALLIAFLVGGASPACASSNRSTYIEYGVAGAPALNAMALDRVHQQVFTAWTSLDRIDVLSTVDYHLIKSIITPSPATLDISPDSSTIAVGNGASTVSFFSTATYQKTAQVVIPQMGLGIIALAYGVNSDLMLLGSDSNGNGITAFWSHAANAIEYYSGPSVWPNGPYIISRSPIPGQLTRSSDYTRFMVAQTDMGEVQIIDGSNGRPLYTWNAGDWSTTFVAAASGGQRYAICAGPVGYTPTVHILDANFNELYEDPLYTSGICYGMTFSPDGGTLYGDATVNGVYSTLAMNMTTFQTTSIPNYFTEKPLNENAGDWQAADSTGMLYGIYDQDSSGQPVWVALDTTQATAPVPPVNSDELPIKLVRVIDNVGSPQGGDKIDLLCQGLANVSANGVEVTIGGQAAVVDTIMNRDQGRPSATTTPAFQTVTVTTPPGSPGLADVSLQALSTTSTLSTSFQYAQSRTNYSFSTVPTFLLYDSLRNLLYAADDGQVEVIDPIGQRVLAPLVPASGKLANSNFAGISLSPDGNRLWVADAGANLIHMISLDSPGTGYSINPAAALGSSTPVTPLRVFELSDGTLLGSTTDLFLIDPAIQSGNWVLNSMQQPMQGYVWNTTNQGNNALVTYTPGGNGIWNVNTGLNVPTGLSTSMFWGSAANQAPFFEAAANEDGTLFGGSAGTLMFGPSVPLDAFKDFNLNVLGVAFESNADPLAHASGLTLHPSGALYYQLVKDLNGLTAVDVTDVNHWQSAYAIALPGTMSYSPLLNETFSQHQIAIDPTGQYIFAVTSSGITETVLNSIPLSIGNIQPAFAQAPASQTFTIRGSGFQSGSVVSFGGVPAPTTYTDPNTLTATPASLSAGWFDVTVTLPGGATYTAPNLLHVLAQESTPVITGSSPSQVAAGTVGSLIGDVSDGLTVTLVGTGFDIADSVLVNGQTAFSSYIDSQQMKVIYDASLAQQAGNIDFTVISPYTGSSNTYALPVVAGATPQAAMPQFSPVPETYTAPQQVNISAGPTGTTTIYYTTDGSTPTTASPRFTSPITVSTTETIKAIATGSGLTTSPVASATYTIVNTPAATPTFSIPAGTYTSAQTVSLSDTTFGAVIYYTIDGTTPTAASMQYSTPISVSESETIQAIATANTYVQSAVASAAYTINLPPPSFALSSSTSTLTVNSGSQGSLTLTVTPQNGFNSTVTFACAGLPASASCHFNPSSVTPSGGAVTTQLTIAASASATVARPARNPFQPAAALALACCLLFLRKRRTLALNFILIAAFLALTSLTACGGGGSVNGGGSGGRQPTSYTVTVTATSGTLNQSTNIALTLN